MAKGRIRSAIKKKIRGRKSAKVDAVSAEVAKPKTSRRKAGAKRLKSATVRVMRRIGTVKEAFHSFDAQLKLQRYKIRLFEPKVLISVEKGHFTVKTVETPTELEEVLKLRFDVFNREYMKKKQNVGVDVDKLDFVCDHLVIRDNRAGRIVGTYRLNSSTFSDKFYSSGEFHFEKIKALPGNILELGRAAIDKDYRTGVVIALLWRGISEYMLKTKTDILLGCASVKTMEPLPIGLITYHLEKKGILKYNLDVEPTRKYKVKTLGKVLDYIDKNPFEYNEAAVEAMIPPLFASYIKMGFKAYGEPALDSDFNCIDYLIMIRLDELEGPYKRRYNDKGKAPT